MGQSRAARELLRRIERVRYEQSQLLAAIGVGVETKTLRIEGAEDRILILRYLSETKLPKGVAPDVWARLNPAEWARLVEIVQLGDGNLGSASILPRAARG